MKIRFESFNIRCYFIKISLFLLFLSLLLFHHGHLSHDRLRMLGILISFHDHQVRMGRETESWSGGPWPLSRKSGLLIANATADGHEASTWFMAWHDGIRWAKNPASHESQLEVHGRLLARTFPTTRRHWPHISWPPVTFCDLAGMGGGRARGPKLVVRPFKNIYIS